MWKKSYCKVWTEFYTNLYRKVEDRTTTTSLISERPEEPARDSELILEVFTISRPDDSQACTVKLKDWVF